MYLMLITLNTYINRAVIKNSCYFKSAENLARI